MSEFKKRDGFFHERLIVIPKQILDNSHINPLINTLSLSDIGYFPKAWHHYRQREEGCDNYIFILCVEGQGTIELGEEVYRIDKNQYFIIPKGVAHRYYADEKAPWSIYWFHFNGTNAEHYMNLLTGTTSIGHINTLGLAWFVKYFNIIYQLLESGYSNTRLIAVTNLLGLMMTGMKVPIAQEEAHHVEKNPVDGCIDYMADHIKERLTLKELSQNMSMSRSHIIALFKEHTGYTPIDYFIHLKIQKACSLLDTTSMSVNEVASYIGYDDPFYFSRIFSKVMGMSPRVYRNTEKG